MIAAIVNTGESTKLQPRFKELLVVIWTLHSDIYRVTNLLYNNKFQTTAHIKFWKNYQQDEDNLDEKETDETVLEKEQTYQIKEQKAIDELAKQIEKRPEILYLMCLITM